MKRLIYLLMLLCMTAGLSAQDGERTIIKMETTMGDITIALYGETPKHSQNFKKLVEEGVYDSLLFHRVICDFMIQGGDPESKNAGKDDVLGESSLEYQIDPEFRTPRLFHKRGAVAMAREGDAANPERRSSSCQFYIVTGRKYSDAMLDKMQQHIDRYTNGTVKLTEEMRNVYRTIGGTPHLDGQYTVFGEVIGGMDVVDKIQHVETGGNDRPLADVRILKASVIE